MKTIDDLPIEILTHILFFTSPYIDIFVKLRLINSKWNEAVKHRLSRVKHLIQNLDDRFNDAPIRAETMFSIEPECSYFDDYIWDDKYTRYFISLMEMLPGLQAVDMENPHRFCQDDYKFQQYPNAPDDLSIQNALFSYFNSRPTIKALGVHLGWPWDDYAIDHVLKVAVKLQNIAMLSIVGDESRVNCKQFIEYFFPTDHEFEQLWLNDGTDACFIFQKKTKIRKLYLEVVWDWSTGNELTSVMPNYASDLVIFGVSSRRVDILEYLSKVTSLSPKLTSIHVEIDYNVHTEPMKNFKQFNQVENLVIETMYQSKSWLYAEKILRMYPMVKNLSIKYSSDLSQDKILGIFRWMPNLSILYLVYCRTKEVPWTVNVDNLVSNYNQLHGRLIKIRVEETIDEYDHNPIIFKHGFDFMKHIFYSINCNQPHILLE